MVTRSVSAKKRVGTSKKRKARNLAAKRDIRIALKKGQRAIASGSADAKELFKNAVSVIDKAVERGIIHKNKAARQKSRLQSKFNAIKG